MEDLILKSDSKSIAMQSEENRERLKNGENVVFNGAESGKDQKIMSIAAIKYNELKRSPGMDYIFVWDEALSMEGNSAPYLQYVYVRTKGVLNKSGEKMEKTIADKKEFANDDERSLARWLVLRFAEGEVVESAARNFAPQQVCAYLFETAQKFNGFYERNKVLGVENQSLRWGLQYLLVKQSKRA